MPLKYTLFWLVWHMPPSCPLCSSVNALLFNAHCSRNTKQWYLGYWLWESSFERGELTEQEAGTSVVHPVPVLWTCHHCCLPPVLSPTDWFPAAWRMTGMRGASQVRAIAVGMRWCWRQSVSIQRWLEQVHKWIVLTFQRNVQRWNIQTRTPECLACEMKTLWSTNPATQHHIPEDTYPQ
jgi:hypothetical protein